jgi:hypothetical protein
MKKILILFCLAIISLELCAQTGAGWTPVLKKQNFKDETNFTKPFRIAGDPVYSTAPELNVVHNIQTAVVWYGDITIPTAQIDINLKDNAPSKAGIDSAIHLNPLSAGKGFARILKDTNGEGLLYLIISDGVRWHYFKSDTAK